LRPAIHPHSDHLTIFKRYVCFVHFASPTSIQSSGCLGNECGTAFYVDIVFAVDQNSTSCRLHVDLMSTSCRPHVDLMSTSCRPHVDLTSTSYRPHDDLMSTSCRPHVDFMSTFMSTAYQLHVDRKSVSCRPGTTTSCLPWPTSERQHEFKATVRLRSNNAMGYSNKNSDVSFAHTA
jgi:hypothetical protein